ncbi:histidine kinase [Hyphomicrobium methylovorum]|uniref:sensor histidine kinase n=1 Tax=Hyphomicrobium methylovorum TaxID=84 RepID=UPI0015E77FB6|nr:CHASE3 domain-containing protein [Hyphomicrobium methylovorum]MBA2126762.1 histidine kinase [Hyphomicrobium methylovorum]
MALHTPSLPRAVAIWIGIAVLSAVAALAAWRWTVSAAGGATHTQVVQQQLARWWSAAQDLENGQRGYLLTGDERYLAPYRSAKASLNGIYSDLSQMVANDARDTAVVRAINDTINKRLASIDLVLAEAAQTGAKTALRTADYAHGKEMMDRLRQQFAVAQLEKQTLFEARIVQFRDRSFWLLAALLASLLASGGLAMIAIVRERQRAAALELTALALTSANRSLEERVAARTEELADARDRAEVERERAEALLRDVTHRIGNTLSLVVGFINLHIRHTTDERSVKTLTGARDRIHAIASAQRRINVANDLELVRIDTLIHDVMGDVVAATAEEKITLNVDVRPLLAPAQIATSLCVLVQEFVINSLKHAFVDEPKGNISVCLRKTGEDMADLIIEDDGVGLPEDMRQDKVEAANVHEGLGTKIAALLTRQFAGTIRYELASPENAARPGTRVIVRLTELPLTESSDG